jgi:hypothetical protein
MRIARCATLSLFTLGLGFTLGPTTAFAAPAASDARSVVGTVLSPGSFEVAHIAGIGTATVLNGDQVEALATQSRVLLKSGVDVQLAPHTSSNLFNDHAQLNNGTLNFKASAAFYVNSHDFIVTATEPRTEAILQLSGSQLTVNVTSGSARIGSASGDTLARISAGSTLSFDPLSYPPVNNVNVSNTTVRLLGVLDSQNGHYLIRDRFSNSVSEVVGGEISPKLINHQVMIDGTWIGNDKSTVAQVDHVVHVSKIEASDAASSFPCRADGSGGVAKVIGLDGLVSKIRNHYLLKDQKRNSTYEIVGNVNDKDVGTDLKARGFVLPDHPTILPAEKVVYIENRVLGLATSPCAGAIIGGIIIGTGTAVWPHNATVNAATASTPISF